MDIKDDLSSIQARLEILTLPSQRSFEFIL